MHIGRPRAQRPSSLYRAPGGTVETLPSLLATAAWAFGHVRHNHRIWSQMTRILVQNPDLVRRLEPEELVMLSGGFSKVKVYDRRLFKQVAQQAVNCMHRFTAHQLAQIAGAFSEVRHLGEDLMLKALCDRVAELSSSERAGGGKGAFELADKALLVRALSELNSLPMVCWDGRDRNEALGIGNFYPLLQKPFSP